jgi:hypothetical protein
VSALTEDLKTARGKRYYDILRLVLAEVGGAIEADARAIVEQTGKITPLDVGRLATRYDLNFKATCEHLEDRNVLPCGTHQSLVERGLKVKRILAATGGGA